MPLETFLAAVAAWAAAEPEIVAMALIGSQARGTAMAQFDIDLVILAEEPAQWLDDRAWLMQFGEVLRVEQEDWGVLKSLRVYYADGAEVEFGIAPPEWAALPSDPGTAEVVGGGMRILHDPQGIMATLLAENGSLPK